MSSQIASTFQLINFEDPEDFIAAVKKHDDSYMNFALGALQDSLGRGRSFGGGPRTLVAVSRDGQILATVTKVARDFSWIISIPREVIGTLDDSEKAAIIQLFVESLPTIIDPKSLDKLLGPSDYVDLFLERWVIHMREHGLNLKLLDPFFRSKVSYATVATLPVPNPAFNNYKISLAHTEEDKETLAHFYVQFLSSGPHQSTLEEARGVIANAVNSRDVWICRVGGVVTGYILTGRFTLRTVAIKNVFVTPSHRRKGIAEALVRAVTRYYLGADPRGFEGGPDAGPSDGKKEEVCLNVATEEAERLYKRTGFLFGAKDPLSGKEGWYASCWRGVEEAVVS
ncbi:hypothetical protein BXZ70DRAFT_942061 [Cristinia sonorae]|uniref:N-acetyltransferase domain-containing protein n=1 Tax=Cristinia sonorae TaxID=1940300 RepID=A0A8K0UMK6_9AGAR|nr:hypothetical protein BXZ70DRAFT_942061 [Cristinia sonorae]